jgi:hypothetical protein
MQLTSFDQQWRIGEIAAREAFCDGLKPTAPALMNAGATKTAIANVVV